jgi:hypothetical protein
MTNQLEIEVKSQLSPLYDNRILGKIFHGGWRLIFGLLASA